MYIETSAFSEVEGNIEALFEKAAQEVLAYNQNEAKMVAEGSEKGKEKSNNVKLEEGDKKEEESGCKC